MAYFQRGSMPVTIPPPFTQTPTVLGWGFFLPARTNSRVFAGVPAEACGLRRSATRPIHGRISVSPDHSSLRPRSWKQARSPQRPRMEPLQINRLRADVSSDCFLASVGGGTAPIRRVENELRWVSETCICVRRRINRATKLSLLKGLDQRTPQVATDCAAALDEFRQCALDALQISQLRAYVRLFSVRLLTRLVTMGPILELEQVRISSRLNPSRCAALMKRTRAISVSA